MRIRLQPMNPPKNARLSLLVTLPTFMRCGQGCAYGLGFPSVLQHWALLAPRLGIINLSDPNSSLYLQQVGRYDTGAACQGCFAA